MSTNSDAAPDIEIARQVDRLMRRIHAGLNARAGEFDVHQVGPMGGILLLTLAEIEPARMQRLVKQMSRDKSQMTRLVQSLERKGLIERSAAPEDGRGSLLALTPQGRATVDELERAVAEVLDDILTPLAAADRRLLTALLSQL